MDILMIITKLTVLIPNWQFSPAGTMFIQCNRTVALDVFFDQIISEPTKLAVMGSGCSVATEPTAEISHYYNISQVI